VKKVFLCLIFGLSAACGGGDEDTGNTMVSPTNAAATVNAIADLRTDLLANDGSAAAGSAFTMAGAASTFVVVDPNAASVTKKSTIEPKFGNTEGTCECTDGSCTFTDCGGQGFKFNGTISRTGDTWTFDLTAEFGTGMGLKFTWSFSGEITVTETTLVGNLKGDGTLDVMSEQGSGSITYKWELTFTDITFDEDGCATAGSMSGKVSYKVEGGDGSGNYAGSGEVTFDGSTCTT
jgi:hypothetical protein